MSEGAATVVSPSLVDELSGVAGVLVEAGRDDLADRVRAGAARIARPQTVVCVVGEFKQGKSLLVNAMLGRPVCPVDDDLATSVVTVIQHAPQPSVVVVRRIDGARVRESIDPPDLARYVTESGNPGNHLGVEQVAIGLDHPLLARGYALVDTPGMGGLGAGHAAATLAFLPYADAVLLVSDASAELSAPEIELLARAEGVGPQIVQVLTKTDLHPRWRTIEQRNRAHLAAVAPAVPVVAVSSAAHIEALSSGDEELFADSGVVDLVDLLDATALDRTRGGAVRRAVTDALDALGVVDAACADELAVLGETGDDHERRAALADALGRLEQLRGPGARWSQRLSDLSGDLQSQATHRLRSELRELGRSMDERIETLDSPAAWDELGRDLQQQVAELLARLFAFVDERATATRSELAEMLTLALTPAAERAPLAVDDLLRVRLRELSEQGRAKRAVGSGFGVVRGAQGGLIMLGMLGRFVPAGAAALLFSNPVTLVLGAAFAGKAAADVRKRNLTERRVKARAAVRQYLDDVQFDVGNELAEQLRARQRELRDEVGSAVAEAVRTLTELADRARADAQASAAERDARQRLLRARAAAVAGSRQTLEQAVDAAEVGS